MSMHHRRKPQFSGGTCSQYVVENAESILEVPVDISPENRTDREDTTIVIPDGDDMELQESILPKKRRKPPLHRKPLPVKRKIAQMTEEEQLALAVEMSQQEQTKQEKYTEEEEDELIKKAIRESLHSCQVTDSPISATHETPSSSKEEPSLSQVSRHSDEGLTRSPVVVLQRLSQDIVDSPSVVLSPNCKDPVSCIESRLQAPLSPCNTSNFIKLSPGRDIALSPVFPKKSPSSGILSQERGLSVLLQRLSQDIVENSSVVLSPNCKDPVSCLETGLQSPLSPCTSKDFGKLSSAREVALSPVFPRKVSRSERRIPCRLFQERSQSEDRLVDDLDDQCTHCSESSQIDSSSFLPTSCSQGEISDHNDCQDKDSLCSPKTKETACEDNVSIGSTENSDCRSDKCNQRGTVHYYWGVPFCPKGVDPSEYTKVILCQLEVYQKSLKSAQRQLLHKMDYGHPIHLQASSQEKSKEDSQSNISQEETEDSIAEDDTQKLESEQEQGDKCDSQETMSSKRQKTCQSPEQAVLENDHCSLSQSAKDNSKAPFPEMLPSECAGVAPVAPGESAVSPTAVRNDRHLMEHTEITLEEDITICPETQPSPAKQDESDQDNQTEVMEIAPDTQACISSEPSDEDIICLDKMFTKNVACPMCECTFPRSLIERHAANCDGTNSQQEMAVLRSRNKLMRRSHDRSAAISLTPKDSGKCEKCYLCQSVVLLKDYQDHVDNCLQTAMLESQGRQKHRSIKEYPERNGRLLSMLEQSESSLAESSCNKADSSNMSPPNDKHGDRFSSEHVNLDDSPIRSFVSISEATDCLVDFKKQFRRPPSSRRAGRRGKRRRM
ncbi:LOW QUALITY PROTEIN: BRCA1-A complex subunit RAP80 [Anomaloglossus baeobatrachus]